MNKEMKFCQKPKPQYKLEEAEGWLFICSDSSVDIYLNFFLKEPTEFLFVVALHPLSSGKKLPEIETYSVRHFRANCPHYLYRIQEIINKNRLRFTLLLAKHYSKV